MLESLAAWVLNNYLGQYLENLNTDQLSVGLLQGAVEMENVPLRKDALASLDLPVRVTAGFVGKIRLSIPVRRLSSEPWSISIEQLYVVLGPVRPEEMDADSEEAAARQRQLWQLDAVEASWRAEHEARQETSYYAASYSSWVSYGSSIVGNIVANLQLKIRDVHVRYEEPGFAAGLTVGALTAQSCDERWVPGFVAECRDNMRFKLLELQQLDVYWDTQAQMYSDMSIGQLAEVMISGAQHEFLLSPVTVQARLKRDCSERPLRSRARPRHVLDLQCERLSLSLADTQFQQAVCWARSMEVLDRRRRCLRHRADRPPREAPGAWWRFAILTHLDRIGRRRRHRTWEAAVERAGLVVRYAAVYREHLRCPATLTAEQRALKLRCESEFEFEALRALREWCMMREEREAARRREEGAAAGGGAGGGRGLLQSWFPAWGGWYGGAGEEPERQRPELEAALDEMADTLENSSALKRDAVFGQLNFSLRQAEMKLVRAETGGERRPLFDLAFEKVEVAAESRPRSGSHLLQTSLGALYLHDHATAGTAFPRLVSPQPRAAPAAPLRQLSRLPGLSSLLAPAADPPLFELHYERRPLGSRADYKLHVTSRSLDVVYNPEAFRLMRLFFTARRSDADVDRLARLGNAARVRYESLKRQTREELMQTWEQMVEGDNIARKTWDVMFNISAPHIILPETLQDPSGLLLVLDFGHLKLHNDMFWEEEARRQAAAAAAGLDDDDADDDDFCTPCSTPQEAEPEPTTPAAAAGVPESPSTETISMASAPEMTPAQAARCELQKKMYDRFSLNFSDLQVLVGRVKDNWRQALAKGSSPMHVLDRFTISLQMERRRLATADPEWPLVQLTGNLSHLMVHVSEQKVHALRTLASRLLLTEDAGEDAPYAEDEDTSPEESEEDGVEEESPGPERSGEDPTSAAPSEPASDAARLLVVQFAAGQMSLAVQSRGRAVAELQVCGARGQLTRRRRRLQLALSVHSLLLVDALQTYGADFEILVASHRGVGVDSVSGSLLDSEPCSPCSPASPTGADRCTSPVSLTQALSQRLQTAAALRVVSPDPGGGGGGGGVEPPPPAATEPGPGLGHAHDALITLDVTIVLPSPGQTPNQTLRTVSMRFNTLDVIANQETIVELAGFLNRISIPPDSVVAEPAISRPAETDDRSASPLGERLPTAASPTPPTEPTAADCAPSSRTELTFDFHKLNVLLLRSVRSDKYGVTGRKVATATVSGARIQATLADTLAVSGVLGGLQVRELSPAAHRHPCVLSVGFDPVVEQSQDLLRRLNADLYRDSERCPRALQFTAVRPAGPDRVAKLELRLASVCYTHSAPFLVELGGCVDEFKQYITELARSVGAAAAEMAREMVHIRPDSASDAGAPPPPPPATEQPQSRATLSPDPPAAGVRGPSPQPAAGGGQSLAELELSVVLETPIVVVPESAGSQRVLVAHLGTIALNIQPEDKHRLHVTDMNLYSLDLDRVMLTRSLSPGRAFSTLRADQLYDARLCGDPILYDTALEITLQSVEVAAAGPPASAAGRTQQALQVDGQFVTPVRLSVLKSQYEQIMRTMKNLTVPAADGEDVETEEAQHGEGLAADETDKEPLQRKISVPAQSHGIPIHGSFQLSEFEMELRSDVSGGGPRGLVTLTFSDLSVAYERRQPDLTELTVTLQGVTMEDLLQLPDAPHRYLLHSHNTVSERHLSPVGSFLSTSCPDIAAQLARDEPLSARSSGEVLCGSLPDRLDSGGFLAPRPATQRTTHGGGARSAGCRSPPGTPGRPAPDLERALIQCTVTLRSGARAAAVSRTVDVNFNCLDVVVSPQSWVMVLDFFNGQPRPETLSPPEPGVSRSSSRAAPLSAAAAAAAASPVTETLVRVNSLSLLLNQPGSGPLARATVTDYSSRTLTAADRATTSGRLGALAMVDLTSHGALYKERFVTAGPEAVHFDFVKFQCPDPGLQRDYDVQLRLQMASVQYVHTARFLAELQQFFAHFTQLQDLLNRLQSDEEVSSRGSRISLDVQAGSPVLLLPLSAGSRQLLVADLGRLRVTNAFRLSDTGPPDAAAARDIPFSRRAAPRGRVSPVLKVSRDRPASPEPVPCLLDVMEVSLSDMDVYSAERLDILSAAAERPGPADLHLHSYLVRPTPGGRVLKQKAGLKLVVERNLDAALNHEVPDMSVRGSLSTLDLSVDLPQYKLVRGLLVHNLGEPVGMEPTDLIQPHHVPVTAPETVWLTMSVRLDLQNVSLELVADDGAAMARVDFIRSQLLYESFSDSSKDVDLMSREIRLHDTRFTDFPANKRSNVFSLILQPLFAKTERSLQAELHYRASAEHAQFTVLLNSMRLMGVLDWWREVNEFISASPDGVSPPEDPSVSAAAAPASSAAAPTAGMAVEAGVVTRRAAVLGQPQQSLELKLNVSDCELVLVENPTLSDSAAVILKTTACVQYRPQSREKPLSCELQSCELFSCLLGGAEQETALSIVDPATVNIEVAGKLPADGARGILDATDTEVHFHMEILMQQLNVRVSYHDMKMFVAIMESLPRQTGAVAAAESRVSTQPVNLQAPLRQLQRLGFSEEDCEKALGACQGRLDDAAIWLTQNASPTTETVPPDPPPSQPLFDLRGVKLHTSSFSVCVIDDCGDADVPLVELCMNHLLVSHSRDGAGGAACELSCDYYNRALSGWEPCVEPFKCELDWRHDAPVASGSSPGSPGGRLTANVRSNHQANVNITSTLLELYSLVRTNWTEDYYNRHRLGGPRVASRRRSPFVPFSLKNDTGSRLKFRTVLTSFSGGQDAAAAGPADRPGTWTEVGVDESIPFTFGGRGKLRHQDTHTTRQHQLVVWVEGWQPASPVSVDRVGVYFRQTAPVPGRHPSGVEQPAARVVFAVTLQGTARKLVTVRSALMINNRLPDPMEIKMESAVHRIGAAVVCRRLEPLGRLSVPLRCVGALLWWRPTPPPHRLTHGYAGRPLRPTDLGRPGHPAAASSLAGRTDYRFCVSIERDNYPGDPTPYSRLPAPSRLGVNRQPGHTITLLPPVTIVNLLPCELRYSVSSGGGGGAESAAATRPIQAGKQAALVDVDLEQELLLSLSVEGCRPDRRLDVTAACAAGLNWAPLALRDPRGRLLLLRVRLRHDAAAGWLRLTISAPYWLVNRTGLPLVVAQEQTEQTEAAGQESDHERARSVAPLMFSLSDPEAPHMMVARLGRGQHPDGTPRWCHRFHLQPGLSFRRLRVTPGDSRRPDIVYVVGIETRPGRGRYSDTHIITVSPRFQIDNRSTHRLLLSQRHFAESFVNPAAQQQWVSALPNSQMAFHWPRQDCDNLLCVKLGDVADCHWSGGFLIDRIDSFHINVRDKDGLSRFLRVEVVLQGATYYVVFMDADAMPPPFRVDNFSEVNITYYQSGTQEHYRRGVVRPRCSAPYAWDLPPCQAHDRPLLTVVAPGGQSNNFDLNHLNQGKPLHYDNFMFIAFSGTFGGPSGAAFDPQNVECRRLVLDVADGVVVLRRKEPGVRSQLWRHLPTGEVVHEGSSPPRDIRHPEQSKDRYMVLDIATPAIQPYEYVPLRLRRLDSRRRLTQTWQFTPDGRLRCQHPNLFVQAQDGFGGLCRGRHAVLGPVSPLPAGTPVPPEQAVQPQMQWPGSGELSVRVVTEGPTRVLQVTDTRSTPRSASARLDRDLVVVGENSGSRLVAAAGRVEERPAGGQTELTVSLQLPEGVGVSLVSASPPAELLYVFLGGIVAEYRRTPARLSLDGSVRHIQADCQLTDAQAPCVLHVTPGAATDEKRHQLPAICFAVQGVHSACDRWRIFEHLLVTVKDLTLTLEERLLYHLLHFIGYKDDESEVNQLEESDHETQRALKAATSSHNTRYYCRRLELILKKVRLSVLTSARLRPELEAVRAKFGRRLVQFEGAHVELDPFVRHHPFETAAKLTDSVLEHYKEELKSQAAIILGSTDFLGNPLGFLSDVSEGVSGLVREGDVGALVKNVTHGVANSTAKVTGSLSDAVGWVTLDEKHDDNRRRIRDNASSEDHLLAGLKGLGLGLWGGASSLVVQPIQGASNEGVWGFFSGIGKGLVGTVTKPAVGILDLATGAANAVKDTSSGSDRQAPPRIRSIRVVQGSGGLLPRFSGRDADGQELLITVTDRHPDERFVAYELLCPGEHQQTPAGRRDALQPELLSYGPSDLRVLISTEMVRVLSHSSPGAFTLNFTVHFSELEDCRPFIERDPYGAHIYKVVLTVSGGGAGRKASQPAFKCQNNNVAFKITELINFGKSCYEELKHTVPASEAPAQYE